MYGADNKDGVAQVNGWLAHNIGEAAIMVSKGPEHFVRGRSHRIFADGRLHQVSDTEEMFSTWQSLN